jgi:hypothetical protein
MDRCHPMRARFQNGQTPRLTPLSTKVVYSNSKGEVSGLIIVN